MGAEAIVAILATALGFMTWSHQQRQGVLNDRFKNINRRIDCIEQDINAIPLTYASKNDLNTGLGEIKDRLNHIDDKLDQLIMSKVNGKF